MLIDIPKELEEVIIKIGLGDIIDLDLEKEF